jgi:hypothetical protein
VNDRVVSFRTKMAEGFPEACLVFGAKKKVGAQAVALSFPAYDLSRRASAIASQGFDAVRVRARVGGFRGARTRVFDRFSSATSQSPNQPVQPTRWTGAVFLTRLLRSTSTCGSKSHLCARQRVADQ